MEFSELNPFLRDAELQLSVFIRQTYGAAYDFRIFYVMRGTGRFLYHGGEIALAAGSLVCFPPPMPYCFRGDLQVIVLNFDLTREYDHIRQPMPPDDLDRYESNRLCRTEIPTQLQKLLYFPHGPAFGERVTELLGLYSHPNPVSDARSSALLKALLCDLVAPPQDANTKQSLAARASLYIRLHACERLSNEKIAGALGYHPYYLNRVFLACTGKTLHQAVVEERIRVAKQLLLCTSLSTEQIAIQCGFADRAHFSAVWKRVTGKSPAQIRAGNADKHN